MADSLGGIDYKTGTISLATSLLNILHDQIPRGGSRIFWRKGLNTEVDLWNRGSGGHSPPEAIGCSIFEARKLLLNGLFLMFTYREDFSYQSGLYKEGIGGVVGATL